MPVVLLLVVIKWLVELFMRFTAGLVGLFLILIVASVVYCVKSQRWQELFIYVLTGGTIIECDIFTMDKANGETNPVAESIF